MKKKKQEMCKRRQADGRMDLLRRHHPLPRGVGWPRHSPPAVLGWIPVLPQAPRCDHQSRVHGKDRLPILRIYYLKKKKKNSCYATWGLPDSSVGKESACNAGDLGSIPGLGGFTGGGNSYSLQCTGLENPMDTVHGVTKIGHD